MCPHLNRLGVADGGIRLGLVRNRLRLRHIFCFSGSGQDGLRCVVGAFVAGGNCLRLVRSGNVYRSLGLRRRSSRCGVHLAASGGETPCIAGAIASRRAG